MVVLENLFSRTDLSCLCQWCSYAVPDAHLKRILKWTIKSRSSSYALIAFCLKSLELVTLCTVSKILYSQMQIRVVLRSHVHDDDGGASFQPDILSKHGPSMRVWLKLRYQLPELLIGSCKARQEISSLSLQPEGLLICYFSCWTFIQAAACCI